MVTAAMPEGMRKNNITQAFDVPGIARCGD